MVGLVEGGRVYMGADSAGVAGWYVVDRKDEKVFKNGPLLMGFTTSFRMGQLLQYALVPPGRPPEESIERYMAITFVNAVRECLRAGGWATKDKERESGGQFLVGYEGRLFEVDDDYHVGQTRHPYAAVGCGRELAMGALHATEGRPPFDRVTAALGAAAAHSIGVRPPFVVLEG